jgi:hypothetical protein
LRDPLPPGSDMDIALLGYIGSVLAGLVGILQVIPLLAEYISRRRAVIYHTRRLRIVRISRPAPWQIYKWPAKWPSEDFRRTYWLKWKVKWSIAALFLALLSLLYFRGAQSNSGSPGVQVSLYIVSAFYLAFCLSAVAGIYNVGQRPYEKWSPVYREIKFTVAGSREDVLQHCYMSLELMGAKIVNFDETQGMIEASIGLWIPRIYTGQRLSISLSSDRCGSGRVLIKMSSDDVSPAAMSYTIPPHARRIRQFSRQWTFNSTFS